MIELLKRVKAVLYETCKLAEEENNIDDFESAFFDDFEEAKKYFVEAKENHVFLNKNLLLGNDSDQESNWEHFFQTPHQEIELVSSKSNNHILIDIDHINQPRSCKCQNVQVTATIGTTTHTMKNLVKILKGNICIPRQQ